MPQDLALQEIARHDWARLAVMSGRPGDVAAALTGLIEATSADDAELHYWELEGFIVVQGQLFEAAPPAVSVLVAALSGTVDERARDFVVELLFQLVAGEAHEEVVARGHADLGDQCRARAREGLWTLYRNYFGACKLQVGDILERIETDRARWAALTTIRPRRH